MRVEGGSSSVIAEYCYDPFGRRLWKEVGGTRTYSLYSNEGLIGEYDGTGEEIKSYGYASGSTWMTDPLFMKQGDEYYFYSNDHLGTPQKMTGVNGGVVWEAKYSSFGEAEVKGTSSVENNLRFPGQYFDQETGLHYNYYRYYDPGIGRYLRADPISLGPLQIKLYELFGGIIFDVFSIRKLYAVNLDLELVKQTMILNELKQHIMKGEYQNLYVYSDSNPINITDPYGLLSCKTGCGILGAVCGLYCPMTGPYALLCYSGCIVITGSCMASCDLCE